MRSLRFNWQIWAGFIISIVAFRSYPFVFVRWPVTRDVPWAPMLLFVVAGILLLIGVRRAFQPDRSRKAKVASVVVAALGVVVFLFFGFSVFILARQLPASQGAPHVGQKAPDFTLPDTSGKPTSLAELGSTPDNGKTPRGVLLIFYRGYW